MTGLVGLNNSNHDKMFNYVTEKHISLYNSIFGNSINLYSKLLKANLEIENINKKINIMRNSKSWRLTQPFRKIMSLIKK